MSAHNPCSQVKMPELSPPTGSKCNSQGWSSVCDGWPRGNGTVSVPAYGTLVCAIVERSSSPDGKGKARPPSQAGTGGQHE